jgi:U3 small nucleolar RNA-associated protein 14
MKKNVTYSLAESEIKKLKELAKREKRSQSNMIAVLINEKK